MNRFMLVRGSNGVPFYVNIDFVKMIKASRDPEASRLILRTSDGQEESISVLGRPSALARAANGDVAQDLDESSN